MRKNKQPTRDTQNQKESFLFDEVLLNKTHLVIEVKWKKVIKVIKIIVSIMLICGNEILDDIARHKEADEKVMQAFIEDYECVCQSKIDFSDSLCLHDLCNGKVSGD